MKQANLRRGFLAAAVILAVPLSAFAADRPNILFIFTDDHCTQATSAYGSKLIQTPNMDRIADGGMRFDRCYVTNSICGPSRACIQTGKYSHVNGFMTNGNNFNGDQQTFPKLLRKAGYQTAIVGKWHLKSTPQGFDYYDVLIGQGPYNNPPMLSGGIDSGPTKSANPGYTTTVITDKTLAWLKDDRDPEKPFMLMYQHKAPHRNWMPDEKYQNWLDDVTLPEPETLWDDYEGRTPPASRQTMSIRHSLNANDLKLNKDGRYAAKNAAFEKARATMTEKEIVQWKYQRYVKDYLRCVRSVDDGIGRVLDYLDESGLAKNTIVIYSSDQGWYLGDHGWFDKRWMYEESLRTPLLVRWPGVVKPGSVNNDIVSNIDFAQTFLALAGVKDPGDMHGRSLVPVLKGKTPADWRQSFYYHYYEFPGAHAVARHYGVTTGRHKLIHFYGPSHVAGETYDHWELFDLEKDPNEMKSVYNDPEYAEVRKKLHKELERLRTDLKVPEDTRPGRSARPKKVRKPKQGK